ncbi:PLC-like phosphodiesterase [Phellopilus nigrolimitatus]|nr:PLC-like phosphodiesterase [Phellopilus nigrolimitatus]
MTSTARGSSVDAQLQNTSDCVCGQASSSSCPSSVPVQARSPLRRAGNLLTSTGEPSIPALHAVLSRPSGSGSASGGSGSSIGGGGDSDVAGERVGVNDHTSRPRRRSDNLGASLRRKLSEVKNSGLALRRSLSNASGATSGRRANHARSKSESLSRSKGLAASPEQLDTRRSKTFNTPSLSSGICEASPFDRDSDPEASMDGDDVKVPLLLQQGTPMTKVSAKKKKTVTFRIDPDQGYILWESKKSGIIPIENIKEIRSGADARYYREQFQLSADYEARWLTIVYIADGRYKTLHAVAATADAFVLWDRTLRDLHAVRQELMSGLGHVEKRQTVWERRYWRGADEQRDDRLSFEEVETMCRRLNISFSKEDLMRRFQEADSSLRGFLDFSDFRRFVKLLKDRPELTRLYKRLAVNGRFDFPVFENFMRVCQKSTLSKEELEILFRRHTSPVPAQAEPSASEFPPTPPASDTSLPCLPATGVESSESPSKPAPAAPSVPADQAAPSTPSLSVTDADTQGTAPTASTSISQSKEEGQKDLSELTMSLDAFTTFLLSTDNSVFSDQHGKVWQDMTRPLSEYYISSSHNTYLVGHQLVGVSTIEGYIRALLHSCRSVEIDIYDGESEPVIYHGKTLTSKVPLRDICQAIAKYAFVASPYPVIISAEVHCSVAQQDLIASIMHEVFGTALVAAPVAGRPIIEVLPSPEDLRGRVLLKAKNLYVSEKEGLREKGVTVDTESSSSTSESASDSEFVHDIKVELKHELSKARHVDAVKEIREEIQKVRNAEPIKEIKEEFSKARTLYDKVRRKKSPSPSPSKRNALPASPLLSASIGTPQQSTLLSAPSMTASEGERSKVKMSFELVALLVYTVGVKCRGLNKKETYAPEHVFSLSERTANKVLRQSMFDLVKHNRTHVVRIYPNGTRLNSSNFEPHKYWSAGAQLVAINWQTFDLGYMINHAMFQRNGRAGYVLKPPALCNPNKELLSKRSKHFLDLTIISAQQLPRRKDAEGREIIDGSIIDPYIEVSTHVPDWARSPFLPDAPSVYPPRTGSSPTSSPASSASGASSASLPRETSVRTGVVKNNGFNPVWEEPLSLPFDVVADMRDLVFVRFAVRAEVGDAAEPLAVYCVSLGSLQQGYRHLPLHDAQLSQYLFSTLFVHISVRDV